MVVKGLFSFRPYYQGDITGGYYMFWNTAFPTWEMCATLGTRVDSCLFLSVSVASVEGKRTEQFSEKSLNLESCLKSEVRLPSSKETLQLRE